MNDHAGFAIGVKVRPTAARIAHHPTQGVPQIEDREYTISNIVEHPVHVGWFGLQFEELGGDDEDGPVYSIFDGLDESKLMWRIVE